MAATPYPLCRSCGAPAEPVWAPQDGFASGVCHVCGATQNPLTGAVEAVGGCTTGPGNVPVSDVDYRSSFAVCAQPIVDEARRVVHELGLRPYRVFLTWIRRNARQRYTDADVVRKIELMPVKVGPFDGVRWELSPVGMYDDGLVQLTQVSPSQVDDRTLLGKLDGDDPPPDVEFFYEVERIGRCPDEDVQPGRYTPAAVPYLDAERFEYVVVLDTQQNARAKQANADTVDGDNTFKPARLRRKTRSTLRT